MFTRPNSGLCAQKNIHDHAALDASKMRNNAIAEPTEAGGRLLRAVGPRFDEIEAEVTALSELRDKPASKQTLSWLRSRALHDLPAVHGESSLRPTGAPRPW